MSLERNWTEAGNTEERIREIHTPEGIPLRLELAPVGHRLSAFLIDLMAIGLGFIILLVLTLLLLGAGFFSGWVLGALLLVAFLLRNFYFIFFELRTQGRTPGKRVVGLRVIDSDGLPLEAQAVFVRNVTRDVELFIPVAAFFAPESIWPGAPGWAMFVVGTWALVLGLMPYLNRNRLRLGDLLASTMVVVEPKVALLDDVGIARGRVKSASFEFSPRQLDMYGIYELQVLEDLLRRNASDDDLAIVAHKVVTKIGYSAEDWRKEPQVFLSAFYAALRRHQENKMLLGKRQERKRRGRLENP